MIKDDIKCYLGREVQVTTSNNEIIHDVLIKENDLYTFSSQNQIKLKAEDIKTIYYVKS